MQRWQGKDKKRGGTFYSALSSSSQDTYYTLEGDTAFWSECVCVCVGRLKCRLLFTECVLMSVKKMLSRAGGHLAYGKKDYYSHITGGLVKQFPLLEFEI